MKAAQEQCRRRSDLANAGGIRPIYSDRPQALKQKPEARAEIKNPHRRVEQPKVYHMVESRKDQERQGAREAKQGGNQPEGSQGLRDVAGLKPQVTARRRCQGREQQADVILVEALAERQTRERLQVFGAKGPEVVGIIQEPQCVQEVKRHPDPDQGVDQPPERREQGDALVDRLEHHEERGEEDNRADAVKQAARDPDAEKRFVLQDIPGGFSGTPPDDETVMNMKLSKDDRRKGEQVGEARDLRGLALGLSNHADGHAVSSATFKI